MMFTVCQVTVDNELYCNYLSMFSLSFRRHDGIRYQPHRTQNRKSGLRILRLPEHWLCTPTLTMR